MRKVLAFAVAGVVCIVAHGTWWPWVAVVWVVLVCALED